MSSVNQLNHKNILRERTLNFLNVPVAEYLVFNRLIIKRLNKNLI